MEKGRYCLTRYSFKKTKWTVLLAIGLNPSFVMEYRNRRRRLKHEYRAIQSHSYIVKKISPINQAFSGEIQVREPVRESIGHGLVKPPVTPNSEASETNRSAQPGLAAA
jgi:hypothetical protein